jgi:transposase
MERHRKIVHLFREGMTIRELSLRFRVSYWTVRNELIAAANGGSPKEEKKKAKDWRSVAANP